MLYVLIINSIIYTYFPSQNTTKFFFFPVAYTIAMGFIQSMRYIHHETACFCLVLFSPSSRLISWAPLFLSHMAWPQHSYVTKFTPFFVQKIAHLNNVQCVPYINSFCRKCWPLNRRKQKQVLIFLSCKKEWVQTPEIIVYMLCFSRVWSESSFYKQSAGYISCVRKIMMWFSKCVIACSIALMNK